MTPQPNPNRVARVVSLFINPGMEAEFERFEAAASEIMARHGGAIERRIRVGAKAGPDSPDEIHIVTFPDEAAFDRYRDDPALVPLAELRARAIAKTTILIGADLPPWTRR